MDFSKKNDAAVGVGVDPSGDPGSQYLYYEKDLSGIAYNED